jgi:hypothetical protein
MEPKIPIRTACLYDGGQIESLLRFWAGKYIPKLSAANRWFSYIFGQLFLKASFISVR